MIYTGEVAKDVLLKNLDNPLQIPFCGYFFDGRVWVAFDNKSNECWVEDFEDEETAICWLHNLFEISEIGEFVVSRKHNNLLSILTVGYLQYSVSNNELRSVIYPFEVILTDFNKYKLVDKDFLMISWILICSN